MKNSIQISQLSNGLTVASDPMQSVESLSLGVWIDVGTRHEISDHNGVAHLLEHMTFKGTKRRSALDIAVEIENVGGYMNAHTGREQTAYYTRILAEDWRLALDMIADIVQHSIYDTEELERERSVVLQEIGQAEDNPDDVIFDRFQEMAFPSQAMGRPILGTAEIVRSLGRDALMNFRNGNYRANGMVLAAAGKIEHDALLQAAQDLFGSLEKSERSQLVQPSYRGGQIRQVRKLEQVHIAYGFEGIAYQDPDYYAAALLSQMLGGGMSSRLFQEVREKRGLAYSIGSFSSSFMDTGLFGIYAGTSEEKAGEILPVIQAEMNGLANSASEEELHRAARQLKAAILMSREKSSSRCEHLANQLLVFGRPLEPSEIAERIDSLTLGDIARVARRVFAGNPSLAILGPKDGLSRVPELA